MIDLNLIEKLISLGVGALGMYLAFSWKRVDDKNYQATLKELSDAYRLLLEKTLTSVQVTNTALESITQASKLGERLEAIEGAMVRLGTLEETEAAERPKRIRK